MNLSLITAPSSEPVTLADAKTHLRVDHVADDTYITALITLARETVETFTRRAMLTQTWEMTLDKFPCSDKIRLPKPPIQSVTSVTYKTTDGTTSTWASSNYAVSTADGYIRLKTGVMYPASEIELYRADAVKVKYVAGYTTTAAIPISMIHAMYLLIGHYYENREAAAIQSGGTFTDIPFGVTSLLATHRIWRF